MFTLKNVDLTYAYLDDDFYKFENSKIPEFIDINNSIKILKFYLNQIKVKTNTAKSKLKIYVRREDSFYRKPLNEADIIDKLKSKGYMILNPRQYDIIDQISLFANASEIVAAHGSSLANIIFCKDQHLSAENIIAILNKNDSSISRATVYNTLNLFAEKGLVRRVIIDSSRIYYDTKTTPHSHYFNIDTGEISDFEFEDVKISPLPKLPEHTVQDSVDVIVRVKNSK